MNRDIALTTQRKERKMSPGRPMKPAGDKTIGKMLTATSRLNKVSAIGK